MERVPICPDSNKTIAEWFDKIGFSGDGVTQEQIDNTYRFVFTAGQNLDQELPVPKDFFENPTVLAAAELACQLHQEDRRKVGGDPYFKHPLKTACLCAQLVRAEDFKQGDLNQYYWEIMEAAAFLHDVIEIRRDKDNYNTEQLTKDLIEAGIEKEKAAAITYLVNKLTPSSKEEGISPEQRRREKQEDFLRIMTETCNDWQGSDKEMMANILRLVKVADILANLEETVADLPLGRTNGLFAGKPVEYVVGVVGDRVGYLNERQDSIPNCAIDRLQIYLNQLNQLLKRE